MAAEPAQNFANHRTFDKALTGIAVLSLLSAIFGAAILVPSFIFLAAVAPFLLTLALVWTIFRMRAYATRLQDRIIRLEMQIRLANVLSPELAARAKELELTHLIGLRFASDDELPELVQKVLANKSMRGNDIKKLVKNWQADFLRV